MQVEFRSLFRGKKCVLWAGKYGMSYDNEVNMMNFKRDLAEFKSLPHTVKAQQVVEAITSIIKNFHLSVQK